MNNERTSIFGIISKPRMFWLVLLSLLSVVSFFLSPDIIGNFGAPLSLARTALYLITAYLWVFSWFTTRERYRNAVGLVAVLAPLAAVGLSLLDWLAPAAADWLIRGDGHHGILKCLFDLISCILFIITAIVIVAGKAKRTSSRVWGTIFAVLLLLVLFWMAMEEISWGQRIFHWGTDEFFSNNNYQDETNIHNMATQEFQDALYFGGFLLLVVLSFGHDILDFILRRFDKKFLRTLADFLPSGWMAAPFAVMTAFMDPFISQYGYRYGSIYFATVFSALALIFKVRSYIVHKKPGQAVWTIFMLAAFGFTLAVSWFNHGLYNQNSGDPTEWLETYIAIGILMYAIELCYRQVSKRYQQITEEDRRGLI